MPDTLRAVVVKPCEPGVAMDIDGSLKGLQDLVGGPIQCIYPFDDNAGLVCNDEGKLMLLPLNRALRDNDGEIYDIISGNFAVVGLSEDSFANLTPNQEQKYLKMYEKPERIVYKKDKIEVYSMSDMSFSEFRDQLIAKIKDAFQADGKEMVVTPKKVEKATGSYEGISIAYPNSDIAVCINLDKEYEQLTFSSFDKISKSVTERIKDSFDQMPDLSIGENIKDYSWVKDHLTVELISSEKAADFLENVPSTKVAGDLYEIYRVLINDSASTVITNRMMEDYGVTIEQLHRDANISSVKHFPISIRPMEEVLGMASGQDMTSSCMGLYVCTAENKSHGGAGVVAYSDFAEKAAEKVDGNFYILPSSVHEVLILSDKNVDRHSLEDMVRTVNATELRPEDILSDHVYHYDVLDKKLEFAVDYELRQQTKNVAQDIKPVASKRRGR